MENGVINSDILTIEQAAVRRDCSAATIRRRIRLGLLPAQRVLGRIVVKATDVDALEIWRGDGRWDAKPALTEGEGSATPDKRAGDSEEHGHG